MDDKTKQGTLGELIALKYYTELNYEVFTSINGKTSCDLIVLKDNKLLRVEVKTSIRKANPFSYEVGLKRRRNKITYNFDSDRCDELFVYFPTENKVWVEKSINIKSKSSIYVRIANMKEV